MKSLRKKTGARKDKLTEPDEFLSLTQRVIFYAQENTTQVYTVIGVVVAVAFLAVVGSYIMRDKAEKSRMRLNEAIMYYNTDSPVPGDKPMEPGERLTKAREMFAEIAGKGGSAPQVLTAMYYEANSAMELGDMDAAIKVYADLVGRASGNPTMASLAGVRLFEAYRFKGDNQKAMDALVALAGVNGGSLKDYAHFRLGGLFEEMGKDDQALAEYKKVMEDFKDSPWENDAATKVAMLGGVDEDADLEGMPVVAPAEVKAEKAEAKPAPVQEGQKK